MTAYHGRAPIHRASMTPVSVYVAALAVAIALAVGVELAALLPYLSNLPR